MPDPHDPLALLFLGPTGSGKTALSLALAERFSAEIISCDSVAVYRGMDVGTAKPLLKNVPASRITSSMSPNPTSLSPPAITAARPAQPCATSPAAKTPHRHRRHRPLPARSYRRSLRRPHPPRTPTQPHPTQRRAPRQHVASSPPRPPRSSIRRPHPRQRHPQAHPRY